LFCRTANLQTLTGYASSSSLITRTLEDSRVPNITLLPKATGFRTTFKDLFKGKDGLESFDQISSDEDDDSDDRLISRSKDGDAGPRNKDDMPKQLVPPNMDVFSAPTSDLGQERTHP